LFASENPLHFRLTIYLFLPNPSLAQSVTSLLSNERYNLNFIENPLDLISVIEKNKEKIDCLLVLNHSSLMPLFNQLYEEGILLPVILLETPASANLEDDIACETTDTATFLYHTAEVRVTIAELEDIASIIDQAITRFLHLGPNCSLSQPIIKTNKSTPLEEQQSFLLLQQRRLAEKLKERLGYLGVYYKRNPEYFYRNLSQSEKRQLLEQLSLEYREIILNYFSHDFPINETIDQFVNRCFFVDVSVSQILEIHMELMDDFSQQLKLEGRSEEILLDYRLALIDILAHLGEMYRRSIPREDIPYDLLFRID
jgi:circadian clock protein KaiA